MTAHVRLLLTAVLLVVAAGCATTHTLRTREEFAGVPGDRPIRVFAHDDREYLLRRFTLADSSLHGSGTLTTRVHTVTERAHTEPFEGDIPFSEIVAVTTSSPSIMKTLVFVGVTALFVASVGDATGSDGLATTLGTHVHYPSSGGGGSSCPYVYAWDGSRYRLEAEPFGIAWGRGLEMTTRHLLPDARPENGLLRLRLTNERRETHCVNAIRAGAIDLGSAPAAVLDVEGTPWPLFHPLPPDRAVDRSGHDVLPGIAATDGRRWEGDSTALHAGSGYEDVFELSFTRPAGAAEGSLVVTAINSEFSSAAYLELCRLVGDQMPALAHAIDTDPELIGELRETLRDASLSVSLWNGREWTAAGWYPPEANAVAFTRALRIHVPDGAGDTLRVRLRSMAAVWRIDALAVDWNAARPLQATPLKLISATGPSGEDVRAAIAADDGRYEVLLPPDRVDLTFAAVPRAGRRTVYAVTGSGYLMEWEPAEPPRAEIAAFRAPVDRIAMVKEILRHRDAALAPAYEEWRRSRAR